MLNKVKEELKKLRIAQAEIRKNLQMHQLGNLNAKFAEEIISITLGRDI